MQVKSTVKLNMPRIRQLTGAAVRALELTAEALHTEVVQARVMPFDTGNLQNESTFVDRSESAQGKVTLVSSTPYVRRLYYHPEYNFQTKENPNAKGTGMKIGCPVERMRISQQRHSNNFTSSWEVCNADIKRYPAVHFRTRCCR